MASDAPIDVDLVRQFVESLTGAAPYRWQERLLCQWFLEGCVPHFVDVPTGLGKTRVMALWLAARALGAALPRRLVYVVDRRAVVDQATAEAERLAANLPEALASLGEAAAATCRTRLGLSPNDTLPISTLRGQFVDNRRWLDAPGGAAIIVGTADMIGSRLLFEGYGVSTGMRPVHAGLLGTDSLVLIDEAHLVPPFKALLRTAAGFDRPQPVPAMRVMALSATGAEGVEGGGFMLDTEDFNDPSVRGRLDAPKRLALHESDDLVEAMVERALQLGQNGRRVIVFCNQRDKGAREIERKLREQTAKSWKGHETTALLVGARRGLERAPNDVLQRFMPGTPRSPGGAPSFLVATSAGEVGIDLDADHMVCDLVAWERMVQRLGRVNRTGRSDPAIVDVFWTRSLAKAVKEDAEDEVEDQRLATWRAPFESPDWPVGEDGRRQAGPGALIALNENTDFAQRARMATTPVPLRPALTRPLVEAWAMTSLDVHPGRPRIEPWLRGWVENRPQARVIWRRVLPVRQGEQPDDSLLEEFFSEFPPHLTELLETDASLVAGVLKARAAHVLEHLSGEDKRELIALTAVFLSSGNKFEGRLGLSELANSDLKRLAARLSEQTIVLDSRLGGLSAQGLLDPKAADVTHTLDAARAPATRESGWTEDTLAAVGRRLRTVAFDEPPVEGWVRQSAWPVGMDSDDDDLNREWRIERLASAPEVGDAARASRPQSLDEHHVWTEAEAHGIGISVGELSEAHRQVLKVAAKVHDAGKSRALWQDAVGAEKHDRPYAKTTGKRAVPGLMKGFRHEFGSLRDAETEFAEIADENLRDLARHLVAAHHGRCRPVILPFDPDEPPSASEARAREAALRFARLQQRWGPWGLAWWEALLRAADWAASRKHEDRGVT
jgi:CRISPR-associated endonuclease/helicase Cas3